MENFVEATFLLFVRVSAFVSFLPLFGGQSIPRTVKVGLATALTVVWAIHFVPAAATANVGSGQSSWALLAWLTCREATLGVSLGWLMGLILVPVRISGTFIAQEMGLTIATLTSSNGEASSNVLSEILDALAVLLFLSLNGHYFFFRGMHACFQVFPVGHTWILPDRSVIPQLIANVPMLGVQLAGPVVMLLFGTTLALLFVMRQTPQFNLFNFGMPARLLAGLVALFLFVPDLILKSSTIIQRWLTQF